MTEKNFDSVTWYLSLEHADFRSVFQGSFSEVVQKLSKKKIKQFFREALGRSVAKLNRSWAPNGSHKNLMEATRISLASNLIASAARRPGSNVPKVHHWIPNCYLTNFSRGLSRKNAPRDRAVYIPAIDFSQATDALVILDDKNFAHKAVSKNTGFFELAAEFFFGTIEQNYSDAVKSLRSGDQINLRHMVSFLSMLLVQHLRSPLEPGESFKLRTIGDFARELELLLEAFDDGFIYIEKSFQALPFSPQAPTRSRVFVDGARAWFFPLTSDLALTFSERKLTEQERNRMVKGSRIAAMKTAKRLNRPLYGVLPADFA